MKTNLSWMIYMFIILLGSCNRSNSKESTMSNDSLSQPAIDSGQLMRMDAQDIISSLTLLITAFGFVYVIRTFNKDIQSRNLNYLAELDKLLIEHPELWAFYDRYRNLPNSKIIYNSNLIEINGSYATFTISNGQGTKIKTIDNESKLIVNNTEEKQDYLIPDNAHVIITIVGSAKITNVGSAKISLQSNLSKELDLKLRGLVFYTLNHYEVFMKDKRLGKDWERVTKYNLENSTFFRNELKEMLEKRKVDYEGLYLEKTWDAFLKIYNEYADKKGKNRIQCFNDKG